MGKKTKLNWKPVILDQNLLSKSSVEGLIGIEELSDYSFKKSSDFGGRLLSASSAKKRPTKKKVNVTDKNNGENNTDIPLSVVKKKRKRKNKKKKSNVSDKIEGENSTDVPLAATTTPQKKKRKQRKKKKKVIVTDKSKGENTVDIPLSAEKETRKRKISENEPPNAAQSVPKEKRKKLKDDSVCNSTEDNEHDKKINTELKVKKTKPANKTVNTNQNEASKKKRKALFSSATVPKAEEAIDESQLLSVMSKWNGLFVPQSILKALHELGFKEPTRIQVLSLPAAIKGRKDMMGAAETGSGKTLAFGIPILAGIMKAKEVYESKQADESDLSSEEEEITEDAEEEVEKELIPDDNDTENNSEDDQAESNLEDNDTERNSEDSDAESISEDSDVDEEMDCDEAEDEISEKTKDELTCVRVVDNVKFPFSVVEEKINLQNTNKLWALVLTPTRELAIQVYKHLIAVAKYTSIKTAVLVGGMAPQKQERMLRRRPEIVVATPGRLWELIQGGNAHLSEVDKIRFLAVDEADRMLEAGHFQELKDLLERINKGGCRRQNFVYSATLSLVHEVPKRIRGKMRRRQTPGQKLHSLAELIGLKDPKIVDVTPEGATAGGLVETRLTSSSLLDRDVRLASLLTYLAHSPFSAGSTSASKTIVFCNSVGGVRRLGGLLAALQLSPYLLHAGMQQRQRLRSLERFSQGGILLATDVAARGLDLPLVDHVIHFQVPRTSETYVHRSGRTARANREGLSVLLVEPKEVPFYERLCRNLGKDDGLPLFPLDEKLVNLVKERVRLARAVDFMEHQLRRSNAEGNWIQKTMKDADIILDETDIPKKYDLDNPQLKKELKVKKKELEALLRKTLMPMGFSPRYPTMNGKLEIPSIGAEAKTVDAVKSKLVERKNKRKLGRKFKKKPNS